jgi:O-antigen ligase
MVRQWQKYHGLYDGFRPGGTMGDPNYFASSALLCLPVAFYLAWERPRLWQKVFCLGCLAVISLAVLLASSRGGLLGLCAAAAVMLLRVRKRRMLFLTLALCTVLLPNVLYTKSPLWRLVRPTDGDEIGREARMVAWSAGVRMIQSNPLFGIGIGQFKPAVLRYEERNDAAVQSIAHNSYLELAAELGLPAAFLFVVSLISSWRTLERVRKRSISTRVKLIGAAANGLQAGLAGASVSIFFISGQYQKLLWLALSLSLCLPALARAGDAKRAHGRQRKNAAASAAPGTELVPAR